MVRKWYNVCVECERVNICMVNSLETFSMTSGAHNSADVKLFIWNRKKIYYHCNDRRVQKMSELY